MPRQLTSEELRIIRQTEAEGMAASNSDNNDNRRNPRIRNIITGILIFAGVFVVFALVAYLVVSNTAR